MGVTTELFRLVPDALHKVKFSEYHKLLRALGLGKGEPIDLKPLADSATAKDIYTPLANLLQHGGESTRKFLNPLKSTFGRLKEMLSLAWIKFKSLLGIQSKLTGVDHPAEAAVAPLAEALSANESRAAGPKGKTASMKAFKAYLKATTALSGPLGSTILKL
jgi:hypothetical protein